MKDVQGITLMLGDKVAVYPAPRDDKYLYKITIATITGFNDRLDWALLDDGSARFSYELALVPTIEES